MIGIDGPTTQPPTTQPPKTPTLKTPTLKAPTPHLQLCRFPLVWISHIQPLTQQRHRSPWLHMTHRKPTPTLLLLGKLSPTHSLLLLLLLYISFHTLSSTWFSSRRSPDTFTRCLFSACTSKSVRHGCKKCSSSSSRGLLRGLLGGRRGTWS